MPLYECTFIARQDLSKQDVNNLTDTFTGIITQQGGKVVRTEQWGLRGLAYRINKNKKGHYVMLSLDAPSDAVKELERTMRINEEIVRILTVRVEEHSEEPSAMMSSRSGRDDGFEPGEALPSAPPSTETTETNNAA